MKIAILGSAPSSLGRAPFGDTSWQIWACSPGAYANLARVDEFWEVHRWEPGIIGKAHTQKPWFSPEYVMWMKTNPPVVWVSDPAALKDMPNAKMLPVKELVEKWGHYCWTSSIAYMIAMAIERIQIARASRPADSTEQDVIGLWGVDMAANEELYSGQRSACQFFVQILSGLGISFYTPPESDLTTPPPMYGVSESSHKAIKMLERRRELEARLAAMKANEQQIHDNIWFLQGAIDDLDYMQKMWSHEGEVYGIDFAKVFAKPATVATLQPSVSAAPKRRRKAVAAHKGNGASAPAETV